MYVAFFVVLSVGSYAVIATAEAPQVEFTDPDHSVSESGTFTVGGTDYRVSNIERETSDGEDGGETTTTATIQWSEQVTQSEELTNGSVIEFDGMNWTVDIPNETDVSTLRLVENFTISEPLVTQGNTTYVVVGDGENRTLVPKDQYVRQQYGEPKVREFSEGDTWNDSETLSNITTERGLVTWQESEDQETSVSQGGNVTVGDTLFTANFPDSNTIELTTNYEDYREDAEAIDYYHERINGFWAVSILSTLAAVLLLAMAYLPRRG